MSGEAGGLILIPLALGALPFVLGGLAVAGAVTIGAKAGAAALDYERRQRREREAISNSNAAHSIGDFRRDIQISMNEERALNIKTSEQMMRELEAQRSFMLRAAEKNDAQAFQEYAASLKNSRRVTMQKINEAQDNFNKNYQKKISDDLANISRKFSARYESYINELASLKTDMEAKNKKAEEIAGSYIEEARALLKSLSSDFEGEKFSGPSLTTLTEQFNQAVKLFNNRRFESSIASAKDVAANTLEEIFEADAKKQEWENYFKLCLVLSEEIKTYLESHSVITQEAKDYAEKHSGKVLEDEIVGVKISDYTGRNSQGQSNFDYLKAKADEIYSLIRDEGKAKNLTTNQLKNYAEFLNTELYPAAVQCINSATINMNNAFSRQNISEEIIDFFEEHNFTFNGYAYEDGKHDQALHIGLENQATGEELIITLAPELLSNGDVQTHIDLKQIKGDEANEERKAYYREAVEEVVKGNTPGAQVNIKCNASTRNKLSSDTETKKKLRR